ncbi:MAG: hypothetical protein QOF48_1321 [Verrucomicrobiota bacterium]|jgi:hypothetical protein
MLKFLVFAICWWPATRMAAAAPSGRAAFQLEDWLLLPLRVHLLAATNAPAIHTTLTDADIARILKKMNGIWSQAGITFWLESLVREEAAHPDYVQKMGQEDDLRGLLMLRPVSSRATNLFHIYYVKQFSVNGVYLGPAMFVKDSASLVRVPGGLDEPLPRVSSHELGHALSLAHHAHLTNLMARGTTGTNLDNIEIQQARGAAAKLPWAERAIDVARKAEMAASRNDSTGARALHRRIAVIPLEARLVRRARAASRE